MIFVKYCAVPAEYMPAGLSPFIKTCLDVLSLHPLAKTNALELTWKTSSLEFIKVNIKLSPTFSTLLTNVDVYIDISFSIIFLIYLSAYSGPLSVSLKVINPNPSWIHCFNIPPNFFSLSTINVLLPFSLDANAAESPAGPPPITITSKWNLLSFI